MYSPLIRRSGIIAFHDVVEHLPETGFEASKSRNEIRYSHKYYKYLEIVRDWNQKWAGMGMTIKNVKV